MFLASKACGTARPLIAYTYKNTQAYNPELFVFTRKYIVRIVKLRNKAHRHMYVHNCFHK